VDESDESLLERWCGGERRAGEALLARHCDDLFRFFQHKVGTDADDLVQRTFLACVTSREQFRRQSSFRTYLFAIARNELYGYFRRLPRGEQLDFDAISIADLATPISGRMVRAQARRQLLDELSTLPADQQLLLELHYWHDLDAAALAEIFDTSAGTVRVRLLRARAALRARLEQRTPAEPGSPATTAVDPMAAALAEHRTSDEAQANRR
jgi:RNA polymerase sigma factor (sigma-70 family)